MIRWEYQNGFEKWMKARIHIEKVRTAGDAFRVIEGLKKLFENQMLAQHVGGPDAELGAAQGVHPVSN